MKSLDNKKSVTFQLSDKAIYKILEIISSEIKNTDDLELSIKFN